MFIAVMDNVEKVFVNVNQVIQVHGVIYHVCFSIKKKQKGYLMFLFKLIYVLVLIVIMEHVMMVVVHVQRVILDIIAILHV
jgi:hypothetical protein